MALFSPLHTVCSSLESSSALTVELVQSTRLPTSRRVLTVVEFSVTVAKGILETQKVSQLTDHVFANPSAEISISFSMCFKEPTATVNILSAGIARAAELQSVLDHLGKYSKFLQTFLALGLAAIFASVNQIYKVFQVFTLPKCTLADFEETQLLQEQHKCDVDITALLQDMTNVLACITDVEQFAKSAQLKQAMEEVNPIVRAAGNFITKYTRILSLTLGIETREELDKLTPSFCPSDINLTVVSLCNLG
ncbi:hypothetical protein B0H14DRAFT_2633055 [Mycena olivaceomarginata]|nr:hypothetical protein B0H14DRAFT_2633055 [Mycena olivaceomarginata]